MDTATLCLAAAVLADRSIRGAARRLSRPVATVAAAIDRLEAALAIQLVHRTAGTLSLTLEGERLAGAIGDLGDVAAEIAAVAGREAPAAGAGAARLRPLSLVALDRFGAVVRAGSIRRGAQRLSVGQPQLTRQIAQIEAILGAPLLVRTAAGCAPTAAGGRLYALALELDRRWAELAEASQGRFRRSLATVRLGSIIPLGRESRIAGLLAGLIARWHAGHRRDHLSLSSMTAEELMDGLACGRFDVAVVDTDRVPERLEGRLLATSPLALVGRRGTLAARVAGIPPDRPLAVPSVRSGLRQSIVGHLGAASRLPTNVVEVDSLPVIVNLVIDHGYVSVLPLDSAVNLGAALDVRPLPEIAPLPLWLVWQPTDVARRAGAEIFAVLSALIAATPPAGSTAGNRATRPFRGEDGPAGGAIA